MKQIQYAEEQSIRARQLERIVGNMGLSECPLGFKIGRHDAMSCPN